MIYARKRLYNRKIMRCPTNVATETFSPLATGLFIRVDDFRAIKQHFMEEGNDYEIAYFDLTTIDTMIYIFACALKGSNVVFEGERAFISLPDEHIDHRLYPCPSEVSRRLLKLLRSRNITAEEPIFERGLKFCWIIKEKVERFCLNSNIPSFASELMIGFLNNFIVAYCDDDSFMTLEPIVFPRRKRPPSKEALKALDSFYREVTENKRYRERSYSPHRAILGLNRVL